ncbi:MAG: hypothetical protein KL863_06860 [Rhizobium sp.]|nr:hypothetical protein [Rhizobium sp.]
MKLILALSLMLASSVPAVAAPEDPVKAIMDLATQLWSDAPPEGKDYFDKDHIGLFTTDFTAAYREAEKYPIYDEGGGPFGYDVITNSQDGCPLKDVSIVPGPETAGTTEVKVTFKLMSCYADDPGKDTLSEVNFKVVTVGGKSLISDIDRIIDGKPASLVAEMKEIAKAGAAAPKEQ